MYTVIINAWYVLPMHYPAATETIAIQISTLTRKSAMPGKSSAMLLLHKSQDAFGLDAGRSFGMRRQWS